jgi:predicted Zn-dependent protease
MKRSYIFLGVIVPAVIVLSGCQTLQSTKDDIKNDFKSTTDKAGELGRSGAQVVKESSAEKARTSKESFKKSSSAIAKSNEEFTPEQEYFIGRSVAAVILSRYQPLTNQPANDYLNLLGQTLAQASDMPEIFRGYRFLILDTDEINAFATPGGHIFITRGLLRCCHNEDAVAAILAHEIGHIQLKHGMQAIKKARVADAVAVVATESVKVLSPVEVSSLTETFSGAISDISNMVQNGYSRSFEYAADDAARIIVRRLGYDPNGLIEMLMVMKTTLKPGQSGFASTHPAPQDRIDEILKKQGAAYAPVQSPEVRQARFMKAVGKI